MESDEHTLHVQFERVTLWKRFTDPHYAPHRYFALMFMSFMGFGKSQTARSFSRLRHILIAFYLDCVTGSYFIYDIPGALQEQIIRSMGVTTGDCTSLYAWYSWPNVILCFFGGYLLDRVFGIRFGASLFATFILAGQLITALGAYLNHFWLMQAGRFVFGIGGESLAVAQNTYAVSWFKGRELNMIFGFQLSFARVGSSVSLVALYPLFRWVSGEFMVPDHLRLAITMLLASATCVFSLMSSLILGALDKRAERIMQRQVTRNEEKIQFTDVGKFCLNFWILSAICVCFYITIFPFVGLASVFFKHKYKITLDEANTINSSIYIMSAIISPLFGFLIDRTGRNVLWISLGTILATIAHALVAFTSIPPYFVSTMLGFGYSILASALWPMISLIIPEHQLGTAYGMMQAIQNLGLGVSAWVAGIVVDYKGYVILENLFLMSLSLTLILILICLFVDARSGYILNMSAKERARLELEKSANSVDAHNAGSSHNEGLDDSLLPNRYLTKTNGETEASNLVY
jgi:MFS family permease